MIKLGSTSNESSPSWEINMSRFMSIFNKIYKFLIDFAFYNCFKGTVSIISSDPSCKGGNA